MKDDWTVLTTDIAELSLAVTLATGQSFRWSNTTASEWTTVTSGCFVTLRQSPFGVSYRINDDTPADVAHALLVDYFQLAIPLAPLFELWKRDPTFKKVHVPYIGQRVLRQPVLENTLSFICSSNNNISRIELMVTGLCRRYGSFKGALGGVNFYAFPTLQQLLDVDGMEQNLRDIGFGYRARYIERAVGFIAEQGGESWLEGLRGAEFAVCKEELLKICGVGPKVADCIALFSLDQPSAIPVDTHVLAIAIRSYRIPHPPSKSVTPAGYAAIGKVFRDAFGDFAGWAHCILFAADLRGKVVERAGIVASRTTTKKVKVEGGYFELEVKTEKVDVDVEVKFEDGLIIKVERDNSKTDEEADLNINIDVGVVIKTRFDKDLMIAKVLGEEIGKRKRSARKMYLP